MNKTLPERPSLEMLKSQAKELLQSIQSGDSAALERVVAAVGTSREHTLTNAQWVIAREYGFESWTRLKHRVEEIRATQEELVDQFLKHAFAGDPRPVTELLKRHPWLSSANAAAACAAGNVASMKVMIGDADKPVGPLDRTPLLCVCCSILCRDVQASGRMVAAAEWLLEKGANPNIRLRDPAWPDSELSALYFALGYHNNLALGELLLDHGADPNDGESLYHSTEHRDYRAMKLLLARGADPNSPQAMIPMLDHGNLEGIRILLEAACDPNAGEEPALVHAVKAGAGIEVVKLLLNAGADPNRKDATGADAVDWAWRLNNGAHRELYQEMGAKENLSPLGEYLRAVHTGRRESARDVLRRHPELIDQAKEGKRAVGHELAKYGQADAVDALIEAGYPVDFRSGWDSNTMLMEACFNGQPEVVKVLLAHGASLVIRDEMWNATPLSWALFASEFAPHPEHPNIVRTLLEAGSPRNENDPPGSEACRKVLAEFEGV